ncbi:CBS domain-containing protein [Gilvimarinus sp. F26214L]|uniref:CBS domain-containing protein n=1 Tax=Gilvimarinus sp. DZF01 TaxID=3461371 RepID=UPI004045BAFF
MKVGDLCVRDPIVIEERETVNAAAELMGLHQVDSVTVVEKAGALYRPIGVLTERDLVAEVVAPNRDAEALTVADVMDADIVVAREDDTLWEVADQLRSRGLRHAPVVDEEGFLAGVFCMDDVLHLLTSELMDLMQFLERKQQPI